MFFVRTATRQDLEAISALLSQTWHHTYDGIYGAEKVSEISASWHAPDTLAARLDQLNAEFIVADDGSHLGGVAFAAMDPSEPKIAVLHQLYVHPECQGEGIGSDLLQEIAEAFHDATTLRLEVEPANEKAVAFYQARGFSKTGSTQSCGGDSGIPADIFERPLR